MVMFSGTFGQPSPEKLAQLGACASADVLPTVSLSLAQEVMAGALAAVLNQVRALKWKLCTRLAEAERQRASKF